MRFRSFICVGRRKAFVTQLLKKIHQKKKKKKEPPPYGSRCYFLWKKFSTNIEERQLIRKLPPPPAIITETWSTGDARNWLELPPEVTLAVFMKLETPDILLSVSQVCSSWRHLSKDPLLYRSVVINGYEPVVRGEVIPYGFRKIAMEAVARSCGKLMQFSCGNMNHFYVEHLHDIVDSSNSLKSLRFGFCGYIIIEKILEVLKKTPSLEDLYIHSSFLTQATFQHIGCFCPKLKYLQIGLLHSEADVEALKLAKSLPRLRSLRLLANGLTNDGLQAILDGCPHLEYVYLKGFSNLEGELLKQKYRGCDRIKSITVLNTKSDDFGEEYEFHLNGTSDDGGLSDAAEQLGGLPSYKTPFNDFFEPRFKQF